MADLDLRVILSAIDRATGPLKGILSGSKRTAAALRGAQEALKGLQRQGAQAARQQAQIQALRELGQASARARAKVASLQAQLLNAHGGGAGMQRQLARAQQQVQRLAQREDTLRGKVRAAGEALRAAGYDASRHGQAMAQAEAKVARLQRRMGRLGELKRIGQGIGNGLRAVRNAGFTLAGVGAAIAAPVLAIARTAGQFERYEVTLTSLTGSAEAARASMDWLSTLTTQVPHQLDTLMDSFVRLKAFGLDPMDGTLQAIIDQGAKLGGGQERLQGIVLALGQAWAKQKLQGEEILQLVERGVPVWDLLEKATGKNVKTLAELSSKGLLGRDAIRALIAEMGSSAAGAAAANMKTWDGLVLRLGAAWQDFVRRIGNAGVFERVKTELTDLLDRIATMAQNGQLDALAKNISDNLVRAMESVARAGEALKPLLTMLGWIGTAFTALGTSIGETTAKWVLRIQAVVNLIKQMLGTLPEEFARIGAAMVEGVKRGFANAWGALKTWVSEKVAGLAAAAKAALGIQSPSKVFAAIGANLMAGLRLGIDRNAAAPLGRINALSSRLRQAGAGIALGGAVGLASAAPAGGGAVYHITINAPAGADATALALEVERAVLRLERRRAARTRSALRDID